MMKMADSHNDGEMNLIAGLTSISDGAMNLSIKTRGLEALKIQTTDTFTMYKDIVTQISSVKPIKIWNK